jgi:hypothetical protein
MRAARMTTVDTLYGTDWNNIGPRFGFAWDVQSNNKLVVRGGFGKSFNRLGNTVWSDERLNPPQFAHAATSIWDPIPIVYSLGPDYAPNPALGQGVDSLGGIKGARVDLRVIDPKAETPYTYNWFLGVQRELPAHFVVEVNYIGSAGRKWMSYDAPGGEDYNRFAGDLLDGSLDRFNPSFGLMGLAESRIATRYNGFTAQLMRRYAKGFSFQIAYTFGKATDTAGSSVEVTRPDVEKGPTDFDVRQRVAANVLWEIPGPTKDGALKHILGGWQLNAVAVYQTGLPFSVLSWAGYPDGDFNADGTTGDRPNTPAWGDTKSGLSNDDFLKGIFQASDFPIPASGTVGTLGRNTFRGPRYFSTDLSVFKNVQLPWFGARQSTLQLRLEAFNVFNTVNLGNPSNDLSDALFGRSTWARPSREIQLGLKFIF